MKRPFDRVLGAPALAFTIVLAASAPALAQDVALRLADGKPWTATMPNGQSMNLVLQADGSARMSFGFMSRELRWTPTADGLCLDGMPGGGKCMAFVETEGGFAAVENGKTVLVLSRR
jgi:hypothetical protein